MLAKVTFVRVAWVSIRSIISRKHIYLFIDIFIYLFISTGFTSLFVIHRTVCSSASIIFLSSKLTFHLVLNLFIPSLFHFLNISVCPNKFLLLRIRIFSLLQLHRYYDGHVSKISSSHVITRSSDVTSSIHVMWRHQDHAHTGCFHNTLRQQNAIIQ